MPINLYAQSGAAGSENGGNIILMPGTATGSGTPGYVGIGTASPGQKLTVVGGNVSVNTNLINNVSGSITSGATVIGAVSSPFKDTFLRIIGGQGGTKAGILVGNDDYGDYYSNTTPVLGQTDYGAFIFDNSNNSFSVFQIYNLGYLGLGAGGRKSDLVILATNGNVGIGTTSPASQLHTTGTVRFAHFGAGTATFDASGNISTTSDIRLKNIHGELKYGLKEILQINPILFKWKKESGLETEHTYAGFSAQNVMKVIPEAVGQDSRGYYTLDERPSYCRISQCNKSSTNPD